MVAHTVVDGLSQVLCLAAGQPSQRDTPIRGHINMPVTQHTSSQSDKNIPQLLPMTIMDTPARWPTGT